MEFLSNIVNSIFFVEWPTLVLSSHGEYVKMFDIIGDSKIVKTYCSLFTGICQDFLTSTNCNFCNMKFSQKLKFNLKSQNDSI